MRKFYFLRTKKTGLKAIIAVHNTVCGPALGGTRMWNYVNDQAALTDVMRLSRGMTYKNAISGLKLGGESSNYRRFKNTKISRTI